MSLIIYVIFKYRRNIIKIHSKNLIHLLWREIRRIKKTCYVCVQKVQTEKEGIWKDGDPMAWNERKEAANDYFIVHVTLVATIIKK